MIRADEALYDAKRNRPAGAPAVRVIQSVG
jgi:hypothetical protein